ncbi:MAG TPA: NAD(P)H-dependent oxidoreductase [Methanobacteriaceae archaeon]|nr:NAD(P)H-dependent oxidoreductase [Methanobacteriaceae archaeon]
MNVLIVYAHPEPESLNGTLKELAVDTLKKEGHQVQVSDLYALKFKAVLDETDFPERMNRELFNPIMEQLNSIEKDVIPQEIKQQMDKVLWADVLIFQFPIWWSNFPAILKGWFDRVFYNGFAFNLADMQLYDNGPLKGKKAMFSFTTGAPRVLYTVEGPHGEIEQLLNYFHHVMFEFVGMEALPYFGIFGPGDMSLKEREAELDRFQEILKNI